MWNQHINATDIDQVINLLHEQQGVARVIAGGTDLILEIERGVRKDVGTLIDITRIPGLNEIRLDTDAYLHIGPGVTHNQALINPLVRKYAMPLVEACWKVGSPQIRNRGTIGGNLITASPANDTIVPLMALDANVSLRSAQGTRTVKLSEFYTGVRKTQLKPDEMLVDISFKALTADQVGAFYKYGLRNAQAISLVNACVILSIQNGSVARASVTMGAVAPVIIHSEKAEKYLIGKNLSSEVIREAAAYATQDARPIDDLRASGEFRRYLVKVCVTRALEKLQTKQSDLTVPEVPILLATQGLQEALIEDSNGQICTRINERAYIFKNSRDKTLLQLLREDAELTGTKEGCAEGECGACTVFLDGQAIMSCLVPAGRAHGAVITTIEGLAVNGVLNPIQQGFVDKGAVQCGYCTPGMIMSATKLIEENPIPHAEQIAQALAGNLCRCTGYYQIIEAVEAAVKR
jgi:xanthine dehydrogenase iron-sulfur cluster and FAD-binding subunit A